LRQLMMQKARCNGFTVQPKCLAPQFDGHDRAPRPELQGILLIQRRCTATSEESPVA
jgi:hypothetical protein